MLRRSVDEWRDAAQVLERQQGAAWKLIMKMLARGALVEADGKTPVTVSGKRLIRENKELFVDTF